MSLKNPVTSPGIDPGTVQLVAQRINHYATPSPFNYIVVTDFKHAPRYEAVWGSKGIALRFRNLRAR